MAINHNKVVYIHKGEHDDPHGLLQQQYLEGSTETKHTLYSHTASSSPKIDSFKKLKYIYQHFQDSKKIYESDPDAVRPETDNILYPLINPFDTFGSAALPIGTYLNYHWERCAPINTTLTYEHLVIQNGFVAQHVK